MEKKRKYRFGLQKKLVLFTFTVAIITYSTSAFFLYFIYPHFSKWVGESTFTIITLVLGIIWSGILAYFAAMVITKPLQRLEVAVNRAGEGHIGTDVEVSNTDDEIQGLGIAFNKMLENLRSLVYQIEENFNETNANVVAISQKSMQTSEQAKNTANIIADITAGAESSAIAIQTTAESVDDITRIAMEVQGKAHQSEEISNHLLADLTSSQQTVQSLVQNIESLAEESRISFQAVKRLQGNANEVEEIIDLVGNIAKQTNLLALNASIEASRAGEQGKGFAVVAEEVRKLADQSAVAVQGISELIKGIQADVENVVNHFNKQVQSAEDGMKQGTETNKAIEDMTETIHQSAESVKNISKLVDDQLISVQNTSAQAQEVAAIAEETSAGAQEVAATSNKQAEDSQEIDRLATQLKRRAQKLKDTITRFHL